MANIEKLRRKAKLSQMQLATAMGVTQGTVSQWETGEIKPRANKLIELAKILNCSIDELFATEDVKVG
ncbi:DNA-binding XRE family transcriptional regulator [Hydrogenoanaerobacterium saccharovorans]|uniref:DNA-binding transcriptional regulator, XRE-family HTH domain n=1 Tax=Hydrogenoanaerobacterium saccharovorans TaxID=474960 RepID=A0A1H7YGC7_9FIRM|nr:helix-turn-helix transcriptional regulator [Hydrogenoanaerobacterium saccharovorans]RPF41890.1 DNA-binding XRE family transcriptional regulator [Hydrogenoanaerobacterium saccharovorans]SEM45272.1 DNA-binding transcriptional regulator, XRE-family HTH domain [Hydrogenoanaerobacterium saccharovorans]